MQKYLVVEIITQDNGKIAAPVNAFETEEDARSKYHSVLTQAYRSAHPVHTCVLVTADGFELAHECVKHEVQPEPEPEPEPEPDPNEEPVEG